MCLQLETLVVAGVEGLLGLSGVVELAEGVGSWDDHVQLHVWLPSVSLWSEEREGGRGRKRRKQVVEKRSLKCW